jgi:hypothetical protein
MQRRAHTKLVRSHHRPIIIQRLYIQGNEDIPDVLKVEEEMRITYLFSFSRPKSIPFGSSSESSSVLPDSLKPDTATSMASK